MTTNPSLQALLIAIAGYDAAMLALPCALAMGVLS